MSSSKVGLGVTLITLGGVTVVGGLAGTLANALAGLFAPSLLVPPDYSQAGLPLIPVPLTEPTPSPIGEIPGTGEIPSNVPGAIPSGNGAAGELPSGGGGFPELPSGGGGFFGELPP